VYCAFDVWMCVGGLFRSQLVRMEWSPTANFEDRASIAFLNRNLPLVNYTVQYVVFLVFLSVSLHSLLKCDSLSLTLSLFVDY
jgi:hypothetical protein